MTSLSLFQGVSAVKAFYELLSHPRLSVLSPEENKNVAPAELCPILKTLYKMLIVRCSIYITFITLITNFISLFALSHTCYDFQGAPIRCHPSSLKRRNNEWPSRTYWDCSDPCFLYSITTGAIVGKDCLLLSHTFSLLCFPHAMFAFLGLWFL